MKKTLSTILLFFYLMSSFGYATVQHYCSMMQTDVDMNEIECCSSSESSATNESCHIPVGNNLFDSCCSSESDLHHSSDSVEPETVFVADHSNCCETHSEYNQLDESTISKIADTNQIQLVVNEITVVDSQDYLFKTHEIQISSDPSLHFNLPLII